MKALVPDLAMVPRLFTRSALVMPMPLSWIVSVLFVLSAMISMRSSGSDASRDASVRDS